MKHYIDLNQLRNLIQNAARNDISAAVNCHYRQGLLDALHLAQTLPVAIGAEEWISVEDKLPDPEMPVLVTLEDYSMALTYFGDNFEIDSDLSVIAWQPSPDAYSNPKFSADEYERGEDE